MKRLMFLAALVAAGACGATANEAVTPTDAVSCILPGPAVRPASATLHPGDTLWASVSFPSCPPGAAVAIFRWSSSDSSVAVVDPVRGLIQARKGGTITIFASATADPNVKGGMLLFVVP